MSSTQTERELHLGEADVRTTLVNKLHPLHLVDRNKILVINYTVYLSDLTLRI